VQVLGGIPHLIRAESRNDPRQKENHHGYEQEVRRHRERRWRRRVFRRYGPDYIGQRPERQPQQRYAYSNSQKSAAQIRSQEFPTSCQLNEAEHPTIPTTRLGMAAPGAASHILGHAETN
jgi:hypothetical protein